MFIVKICGVTSLPDAESVAESGGDAVGFNFFPPSPRYLHPDAALAIAAALPRAVRKVGVFVNESGDFITRVCRQVGLDSVQLHGDEPAELLAELPDSVSVIRAIWFGANGLGLVVEYLDRCGRAGRRPDAVLVDAQASGAFGGTGCAIDWMALAAQKSHLEGMPLILAGGLTPENVRKAIETVRPCGVDTASGVESAPGVKDHQKIRRFVREARRAFEDFARTGFKTGC